MIIWFPVCDLTIVSSLGSHPSRIEAIRTQYLNPTKIEGVDALLVVGKGEIEDQLLLLRFFLPDPIFPDSRSTFDDLMAHSKGWVARRTGGSAGRTAINKELFNFLHQPGSLPRKAHGTKIVQTELQYYIYYCTPYETERTVKCAHYWQPHRGGSCYHFPSEFIEKHPGLRGFASSKIAAAFLLKAMEPHFCIAKEAVSVEISKIECSIKNGGVLGSNGFFDEYIGFHCEHTIVCHTVGYHNDVFKNKNTNYLENRVVMHYPPKSETVNYPLGRGGCENGQYAWALLDW
jgi:hypothetical protein